MGLPTNEHRRGDGDRDVYHEGRHAHDAAIRIDQNPYDRGTTQHREWSRGWRKADKNKQSGDA